MTTTRTAAISSDIDTLASIYKGAGCKRAGGYTFAELRMGLENFTNFLEAYQTKATLFMVGNDFKPTINHDAIKAMAANGHEIANHTMTHAQGFRLLAPEEKNIEISGMEGICKQVTGTSPKGFRAPGWNISDDALPILKRRGYLYDSSIHPTTLMPLLKILHWKTMSSRSQMDRTTMGHLKYMFASNKPYKTDMTSFSRKGSDGILEFPLTVMPFVRVPFFATFLLATGIKLFAATFNLLKKMNYPIQFQFHLSDFVDYTHPDLADQVPSGVGVYVPQALITPLKDKLDIFKRAMDLMSQDYTFITLDQWANKLGGERE